MRVPHLAGLFLLLVGCVDVNGTIYGSEGSVQAAGATCADNYHTEVNVTVECQAYADEASSNGSSQSIRDEIYEQIYTDCIACADDCRAPGAASCSSEYPKICGTTLEDMCNFCVENDCDSEECNSDFPEVCAPPESRPMYICSMSTNGNAFIHLDDEPLGNGIRCTAMNKRNACKPDGDDGPRGASGTMTYVASALCEGLPTYYCGPSNKVATVPNSEGGTACPANTACEADRYTEAADVETAVDVLCKASEPDEPDPYRCYSGNQVGQDPTSTTGCPSGEVCNAGTISDKTTLSQARAQLCYEEPPEPCEVRQCTAGECGTTISDSCGTRVCDACPEESGGTCANPETNNHDPCSAGESGETRCANTGLFDHPVTQICSTYAGAGCTDRCWQIVGSAECSCN
jgi:hypothetical protein